MLEQVRGADGAGPIVLPDGWTLDWLRPASIVSFTVLGEPAPQGSKTRTKFGGVREANPRTRPYRQAVAAEAQIAMEKADAALVLEAVEITVSFYFERPLGHYGSGKNAGKIKPSAPAHKTTAPDSEKLARAAFDGMAGIVYRNDAQVVEAHIRKGYGGPARTEIEVRLAAPSAPVIRLPEGTPA